MGYDENRQENDTEPEKEELEKVQLKTIGVKDGRE